MINTNDILSSLKNQSYYHGQIGVSEEDFLAYTERLDLILQYNQYPTWVVQDDGKETISYISKSSLNFFPHMDGVDLPVPPRWVGLYCTGGTESGMETYLVDTNKFIKSLSEDEYAILKQMDYVFVDKAGGEHRGPLVRQNGSGVEYVHLTGRGYYAPRYTSGKDYKVDLEIYEYVPLVNKLTDFLVDPKERLVNVCLQKGELFIFDNLRFIHGRVNPGGKRDLSRRLVRVYIGDNLVRNE